MNNSSSSIPFKSKKIINSSTPKTEPVNYHTRSRARNRGVALSVKEVRTAAQAPPKTPKNDGKSVRSKGIRKQILLFPDESPLPKSKDTVETVPMKLPEKYEMLARFFEGLDSTIRLSKLRGYMTNLNRLSPQIERLTDRRFSQNHLAQIKYIFPELLETKEITIVDERTSCEKSDLHVTINMDAIKNYQNSKSGTKNVDLRKLFRARLADFHKSHPEVDDVPEAMLIDPLNISNNPQSSNIKASHLPVSFRKHFSSKVSTDEQILEQKPSKICLQHSYFPVPEPSPINLSSTQESSCTSVSSLALKPKEIVSSVWPATPMKETTSKNDEYSSPSKFHSIQSSLPKLASTPLRYASTPVKLASTPAKPASTPAKLASSLAQMMTVTPALKPQKRGYMSPDAVSTSSPNKLIRRSSRARSLKYDVYVEDEKADCSLKKKVEDEMDEDASPLDYEDDSSLSILSKSLLQSVKKNERKALEEGDPAISQAKRRRQMIGCLPKLFNSIHFFFQSIRRSVITKQELMHKLIASHCDIVDMKELEEQLNLLLELVPEWISEKRAVAGDLLVCINKMVSTETIRARVEEAK